ARHLRQHPSNGRIMKRGHPGGPRATRMKSSDESSKRDQYRAQKPNKRVSWQPFTTGIGRFELAQHPKEELGHAPAFDDDFDKWLTEMIRRFFRNGFHISPMRRQRLIPP
ncbi:MAG: hypothetical protein WCH44_13440, partial [Betaproteobacteria bacterium]